MAECGVKSEKELANRITCGISKLTRILLDWIKRAINLSGV